MKKIIRFFKSKIRIKVFAATVFIVLCFFAITVVTSSPLMFRAFTASTYRSLSAVADSIDYYSPDSTSYYFELYYIGKNNNFDFEIADEDGLLVYTSKGTGSALSSSHFPSSAAVEPDYNEMIETRDYPIIDRYKDLEVKRTTSTNADYFVYSRKMLSGNKLYVYSPVSDVEKTVSVAEKTYSGFSIAMIAMLGIVFFIIISRITKPVEEMNSVTADMATLDFKRKCEDYGSDEIGELGRSINILSETLNSTLIDLKDKNRQLENDIELRLSLDNARKSFISNVSHELKTPIAIISGYAEGLQEGISDDPEIIREYCGIINDESRKMNNLVLELLELSKLESRETPFRPDYFDIGLKTYELVERLSIQAEKKQIAVMNNVPRSLKCYGEEEKIEIVLKNYITNAISHCEGEKTILIDCIDNSSTFEISVTNTGSCIADEDLPEIWDSFFRADKSHGRSENRFGLGLSIVRSIMEKHACGYGVENLENGVKFSFEVAKNKDYYEENKD